jgi:transposase
LCQIAAVDADEQPGLHAFTAARKRDHDAVLNGLTMPHRSGVMEGDGNRMKVHKRKMYGHAKLDLFRKPVLFAT